MTTGTAAGFATTGIDNHPGHPDQKSHGRQGWQRAGAAAEAKLKATAASPLRDSARLGGGVQGVATMERHDGGVVVRKVMHFESEQSAAALDAEVLGSKVARALGVDAPAVVADGDGVVMQLVSGKTLLEQGVSPSTVAASDQGRLIGLHDTLTGNLDRNPANLMTDESGRLVAIDHGMSFGPGRTAGIHSPLSAHFSNPSRTGFADKIDVSPRDMRVARERLASLRSDFVALGRGDWHDQMMDRLGELETRATGTVDRIA